MDHVGVKAMVAVVPLAGHVGPVSGLVAELLKRGTRSGYTPARATGGALQTWVRR